jgi:hypothetical protein
MDFAEGFSKTTPRIARGNSGSAEFDSARRAVSVARSVRRLARRPLTASRASDGAVANLKVHSRL